MSPFVSDIEENCEKKPKFEDEIDEEQENIHQQEGERSSIVTMHNDVVNLPLQQDVQDQHSSPILDDISSPINTQIFDFCDPDMFSDTLQDSETTSSPNHCCYKAQNSSYTTNIISFPSNFVDSGNNNFSSNEYSGEPLVSNNFQGGQNDPNPNISTTSSTTTIVTTTTTNSSNHPNNHHMNHLSIIFDSPNDEIENDISASIDFSPSSPYSTPMQHYNINTNTCQQDQYQLPLSEVVVGINNELHQYTTTQVGPISLPFIGGPQSGGLGSVFEDDGLITPIIPPFLRIDPSSTTTSSASSCSFLNNPSSLSSFLPGNLNPSLGGEKNGVFTSSLLMTSNLQAKDLDFQGDNSGFFCPTDQLPQVYNSGDMQAFSGESSQLVSATSNSAPLATEISSLEDPTFKVGKLSAEQRKEKIHRYLKKRNERNFSKKIKYACRKTLADSRPRVRGRFAKNDDFLEVNTRHMNDHHEDDDYDEVVVKDEDDLMNSSDIFSHISGVNSFKCNYQIQSWI